MAAGLGFKTFSTGEVLTAADVNGYLMQGVLVFASEAARNSAITSPQEGQFAYTKDNNSLWYYTGSAWVASGATGDIEGVTAGVGITGGGTSGTVTVTNSMATAIDAKGDLVVGTGADTFSRLAVGTNTHILTADSAEATGLKWAAPAGGGKVLQVLQDTHTGMVTNNSTTLATTNLSQAITPASASNKVLITANVNSINKPSGNSSTAVKLVIDRDGSTIYTVSDFFLHEGTSKQLNGACTLVFLDSPATTSATTYSIKFASTVASQEVAVNAYNSSNTCVSSIVVMEIGA